jgi:hypothetical protein
MNCDDAAEFVSALCDSQTILPEAADHIKSCTACRARLGDYMAIGVELRCAASVEVSTTVPHFHLDKPRARIAALWQKGIETMRIPRLAFAVLIAGILVLASTLTVVKVRANNTGTVLLITTVGPAGPLPDCPLSTQDAKPSCDWYGPVGSRSLAYRIRVLSRTGDRVSLSISTRTYSKGEDLSSFTYDADPSETVRQIWFEPGEPLKLELPEVGTLTLTGQWIDHMPIFDIQLFPGPRETRFASPLLLKDKRVVGDFASFAGMLTTDDLDRTAVMMYIPGEGRFLISERQMKGAVEARVVAVGSRVSFEEGGHSWEFVNGAPMTRDDHLWVLHQPHFKMHTAGQEADRIGFGNRRLVQTAQDEWIPEENPMWDR